MSEYQIEKGVALPQTRSRYPFATMEVGTSFHVSANGDGDARKAARLITSSATQYGRRKGAKFTVRRVNETDPKGPGIRVWRTA